MKEGEIKKTGSASLAKQIEKKGFIIANSMSEAMNGLVHDE